MKTLLCSLAPVLLFLTGLAFAAAPPPAGDRNLTDAVRGAEGLDEALRNLRASMVTTPPLSPAEALAHFKLPEGLAIDLVASEPVVRQPLYTTFDERGRMWVVQYIQYPFPAGLKVLSYDRYIRAKFDKVPPPPPDQFRGADRITIHEDTAGDGSFRSVKTFVEGLNITTAALPGRGGVWVLNPPYLLFYPDPEHTDTPGRPEVHLSGFGLEDTHAVASSLTWGPDGWLYGAQGSTCTARVKVEITRESKTTDFLGQAIWRYHPETHRFELFAEGGGNTFGVAFDDQGRVYSGTNWGTYRGLHFVQGGYYVKGWGKHGPLTNPYAFGFFQHMPHTGNADRLVHNFLIYGGELMPDLRGKIVGVNPLQRRVQVTRLSPLASTFRTIEEPFLVTTDDGRFRPVDVKSGPDGALYICDLYEPRINHVDPRDNWDRATGRIYRIRPRTYRPAIPQDLGKLSSRELVDLLSHRNRWQRETALRLLGDRKDRSVAPILRDNLERESGQLALESLWALHLCGEWTEDVARRALEHINPHVRRWTVRLLGDRGAVSPALAHALAERAEREPDAEVRSQLASSAKRLPGPAALPIIRALWNHDGDSNDPHIPLLLWWALEPKAESDRAAVLALFEEKALWDRPLVKSVIPSRLVQRYALAGGTDNLLACARLLELAPNIACAEELLKGLETAYTGRSATGFPSELRDAIARAWSRGATAGSLSLGLRLGQLSAVEKGLRLVMDEKANLAQRLECIRIFGEVEQPRCVPVLLGVLRSSPAGAVRQEVLGALQRYSDAIIADTVLELYPAKLPEADGVRSAALNLLASRPAWSLKFLQAVDGGKISARTVPLEVIRKIQLYREEDIGKLLGKHWGKVRASTPLEKQKEMARLIKVLKAGTGQAAAGKLVFTNTCAKCHKLFGEGGDVGPELTGYERDSAIYWLENIVDPSAVIREEYTTFIIQTIDGRTLTGIVAAQDRATVTLRDPEGRTTQIAREKIDDMRASPVSLMPEGQLASLSEQQVRDLFSYLMSRPPAKKVP
jgi:putative heme-binding domain-containing protein